MLVRLAFLGQPQITCGDQPIRLPAKAVGLLALLAGAPEAQPRERLLEMLWPDRDSAVGRKNLRNTLWLLRRKLGNDILLASEDHLALDGAVWVDLADFAQDGQLALYRGAFLDGIVTDDAPEFEHWLASQRERWLASYLNLLHMRIRQTQDRAQWDAVAALAQQGLTHAPLDERMHQALMASWAHFGRRDEALHHFDRFQADLAATYGSSPLPATITLRDAIQSGHLTDPVPKSNTTVPHVDPAAIGQAMAAMASRMTSDPYQDESPMQELERGWLLSMQGNTAEAHEAFNSALAGTETHHNDHVAALACLELAILHLGGDEPDQATYWVQRSQPHINGTTSATLGRLATSIIGLTAIFQHASSDDLRTAAASYTSHYLPELLTAARCELGNRVGSNDHGKTSLHSLLELFAPGERRS